MSIVQVFLDPSTPWIVTGSIEFDVPGGAHLSLPGGNAFPVVPAPTAGDYFVRTDENILYRYTGAIWVPIGGAGGGFSEESHKIVRQLIHFIDGGPAEGFASGAYREITGTTFPTEIVWYDSNGPAKKRIVDKTITWTGAFPTTIRWRVYSAAEALLATVTDTISYAGPFETSRIRVIA
jgi:hypothetical protein